MLSFYVAVPSGIAKFKKDLSDLLRQEFLELGPTLRILRSLYPIQDLPDDF